MTIYEYCIKYNLGVPLIYLNCFYGASIIKRCIFFITLLSLSFRFGFVLKISNKVPTTYKQASACFKTGAFPIQTSACLNETDRFLFKTSRSLSQNRCIGNLGIFPRLLPLPPLPSSYLSYFRTNYISSKLSHFAHILPNSQCPIIF